MDPDSSVHGILQAGILEWIAIAFSRESSGPRDWTQDPYIEIRFFTVWGTREALRGIEMHFKYIQYLHIMSMWALQLY